MTSAPMAGASTRRTPSPNQYAHDVADRVRDKRQISHSARLCFTVLLRNRRDGKAYCELTREEIAAQLPGRVDGHQSISSVKNHLRDLEAADLIWIDGRHIYIMTLQSKPEAPTKTPSLALLMNAMTEAMERNDFTRVAELAYQAEALKAGNPLPAIDVSPEADAVLGDQDQTTSCPGSDNFLSDPPFNQISQISQEAYRPGGEIPLAQPETIALLEAEQVHPVVIAELAHLDPTYVREVKERAQTCGRGRTWPGFFVGCLRTGGVFESSRSNRRRPTRAAPQHEASSWSGPPDQDADVQSQALPSYCATCGKICPPEHEGHCWRCEPELFEPVGGMP